MTVSPYVTDVMTKIIFDRMSEQTEVAARPCDNFMEGERTNE